MPRVIQQTIYKFDELSKGAQQRAIEKYREQSAGDSIHEFIYEDAKTCFAYFGFGTIEISYSGFSSQGDGASFTGDWRASDVKPGEISDHAQNDPELDRLDAAFSRLAARCPQMSAMLTRTDNQYCHDMTVAATCEFGDDEDDGSDTPQAKLLGQANARAADEFIELARACMRWIYKHLEKEYEFQNSDTTITENIKANEYEYDENGIMH